MGMLTRAFAGRLYDKYHFLMCWLIFLCKLTFRLDQLDEAVNVFTSCMKSQPFFLDGIIARGNVCMDYGTDEGLKHAM